jgi:hypothetical protein
MLKKYKLNRTVTTTECSWLDKDVEKGTIVTYCHKLTYGVCTPSGTMVTFKEDGGYPGFELPTNSLETVTTDKDKENIKDMKAQEQEVKKRELSREQIQAQADFEHDERIEQNDKEAQNEAERWDGLS